jgi:dienelactone hydrolase
MPTPDRRGRLSHPLWVLAALLALNVRGLNCPAAASDPRSLRREARAVIEGERPYRGPLQARLQSREERDGLRWERVTFVGAPGQQVPALVARSAGATGRLPAVVALHGLGGSKEGMTSWLAELARRGYLALAIDARWHGERGPGLQAALIRAFRSRSGHPYLFDTVADLFRTLDYLQSRPDVDPDRIGMLGISMGGQETWITAALDPRVKVAVPIIGVNSFAWTLSHDLWRPRAALLPQLYEAARADLGEPAVNARVYREVWERLTPGLLDRFDGPRLLPLIAPRPLLVLNGEKDPLVPVEAARQAAESARRAYAAAGVPERFRFEAAPGVGHAVPPAHRRLALEWLGRWLAGRGQEINTETRKGAEGRDGQRRS